MGETKAQKGKGYIANSIAGVGPVALGVPLSLLWNVSSCNRAGGPGVGQVSVVNVFSEGKGPVFSGTCWGCQSRLS